MNDELRSARERVRKHTNLGNADIADRNLLARAYLALVPADDELAIQFDWLVSTFGPPQRSMTNEMVWTIGHHNVVLLADLRGLWAKSGVNILAELSTRGDLRALLRGLKIPLPSPETP